jgi:DNA-binding NarL/FixJ family response regulator
METLRILIADDHPLFRHGIHEFLNLAPDIDVIGEATSGEEAVAQAEALQPDVILMDVNMPGVNGIEATRRILHDYPHIRILVVTMFEDDGTVFAAMRAGARGYILKDAEKENILRAIQAVGNGEAIFSPTIATRFITKRNLSHSHGTRARNPTPHRTWKLECRNCTRTLPEPQNGL